MGLYKNWYLWSEIAAIYFINKYATQYWPQVDNVNSYCEPLYFDYYQTHLQIY